MGSELVFVEHPRQLKAIGKARVVVLTPAAEYAAERARARVEPLDALYRESDLRRRADAQTARVDAFCDYLDERIRQHRTDLDALAGFTTHDLHYWIRLLFDSVFARCFCLQSAIGRLQPQRITCFRSSADEIRDDWYFLGLSLTPAVVRVLGARYGIEVRELDDVDDGASDPSRSHGLRWWASRARDAMASIEWRARRSGRSRGDLTLIALTDGYDVGLLSAEWERRNLARMSARALRWTLEGADRHRADTRVTGTMRLLFAALERDDRARDIFALEDHVNVFPIVRSRLEHLVVRMLPRLAYLMRRARRLFDRVPGAMVVGVPAVQLPQLAVLAASREARIPTALYQHGGGYGILDLPMVERHDLGLPGYFLAYGDGVSEFLDRPGRRRRARVLPVGSIALRRLMRAQAAPPRPSPPTRTVVYVVTNFVGDSGYFDYRTYPDLGYWRLQREVVRRCAARGNIRLIVKLHPGERLEHPMADFIRDQRFDNCRVLMETPFAALLDEADFFVIDYPSSTSLLQALTTDRRVLAFADAQFTRPDARALELLRRRALVATSREEFLRQLDAALDDADWSVPQPRNDEFLSAYGTGVDAAADRAVAALLDIHARRGSPLADLKAREVTTV